MKFWQPDIPVCVVLPPCEWCGETHPKDALCEHTKKKGMTRRSFLLMSGVGIAALTLMPSTLGEGLIAPPPLHGGSPFVQIWREVALAGSSDVEMEVAKLRAMQRLEREGWQPTHLNERYSPPPPSAVRKYASR